MLNISNKSELSKLVSENKIVLIDFWAEWCGPCKSLAPVLEKVSAKVNDKAVIAKVNVDNAAELAREYAVRSIPTMMFFKDGVSVARLIGLRSEDDIVAEIEKLY